METKPYITLLGEGSGEYSEKKSRFIGYACPCKMEQQALDFIRRIKSRHSDARHHVYAYLLEENHITRYTDDGEPQGTAGVPVLDIIRKNGVCDACIVVIRYFGGILLGTGGLVRAYTAAAKAAVENAQIVAYETYQCFRVRCNYADYQKISYENARHGIKVDHTEFADDVTLFLACKETQYAAYRERLTDATGGNAEIVMLQTRLDRDAL